MDYLTPRNGYIFPGDVIPRYSMYGIFTYMYHRKGKN